MSPMNQVYSAMGAAAAAVIVALGAWVASWVQRKVRENELANQRISLQSQANAGSMARLGVKVDVLHEAINGGQLPSIIDMGVTNSKAVKTLMEIAEHNRADIQELKDLTAGMCRFGAGKSHAPHGQHCPDHVGGSTEGVAGSI